jgi:hypothetical protein
LVAHGVLEHVMGVPPHAPAPLQTSLYVHALPSLHDVPAAEAVVALQLP